MLNEEKRLDRGALYFLEQSFPEVMQEFEKKFALVREGISGEPLKNFREKKDFQKFWALAQEIHPVVGIEWGMSESYLAQTNPEKAGLLCSIEGDDARVFTEEDIYVQDRLFSKAVEACVTDLWRSLYWWRRAVCVVWAGMIVHDLISWMKKVNLGQDSVKHIAATGSLLSSGIGVAEEQDDEGDDLIGAALNLSDVDDKTIEIFFDICHSAAFGSSDCEYNAGEGFRQWLSSASIGLMRSLGVTFEEAHMILLSGSQASPRMSVALLWNESLEAFQFACSIINRTSSGFTDPERTSILPATVIKDFYQKAPKGVQDDFMRLFLRAGLYKAQNLLRSMIEADVY